MLVLATIRYASKCSNFQKKLIYTITTSNFYFKFKENNENDMAAQVVWAVFYSSQRPSKIGPTADFNGAAIPPPIFSMPSFIKWWTSDAMFHALFLNNIISPLNLAFFWLGYHLYVWVCGGGGVGGWEGLGDPNYLETSSIWKEEFHPIVGHT